MNMNNTELTSQMTSAKCVGDFMTRNTVTVCPTDSMTSAISEMHMQSLSTMPVVDDQGGVCGVISSSDLMRMAYRLNCDISVLQVVSDSVRKTLTDALAIDNQNLYVKDFMTASVLTTTSSTSISQAARTLVEAGIHHLLVVDSNNRVVGILSSMDVVRSIAY